MTDETSFCIADHQTWENIIMMIWDLVLLNFTFRKNSLCFPARLDVLSALVGPLD